MTSYGMKLGYLRANCMIDVRFGVGVSGATFEKSESVWLLHECA